MISEESASCGRGVETAANRSSRSSSVYVGETCKDEEVLSTTMPPAGDVLPVSSALPPIAVGAEFEVSLCEI